MNKIKVLLIDYDDNQIDSIKKYFSNHEKIDIYIISKEDNVINYIDDFINNYEIVILDLVLIGIDGISVIKKIREISKSKVVIVNTSYISNKIVIKLSKYEVDSILIKPVECSSIESVILNSIEDNDYCLEKKVINILHSLGIPSHLKGFTYLKESILKIYSSSNKFNITIDLYPYLAEVFSTSSICVEKNIRHAIDICWNRANYDLTEKIFGYSISLEKGKPTNLQYIMTIVDFLKVDN